MKRFPPCMILDKTWYPAMIVNYKQALSMKFRGYDVLETHPRIKIHTPHKAYDLPIIIRVDTKISIQELYVTPSRFLIFVRDQWTCQYCGKSLTEKEATVDHVYPKSLGGTWSWNNLVTCCPDCNQKKGNSLDWKPLTKPERPHPILVYLHVIIPKLDFDTYSIWLNYMPISLKKKAINIRTQSEERKLQRR